MRRFIFLICIFSICEVAFAEKIKECRLVAYDFQGPPTYQIFLGNEKLNDIPRYRNLIPALNKMKKIESEGGCTARYSITRNICYIKDNNDILKGDITHPSVGLFTLVLRDPEPKYPYGYIVMDIALANSREEVVDLGETVQALGLCEFKIY